MSMTHSSVSVHLLFALMALCTVSCGGQPTGPGVIDPDAPEEFTTTESGLKYRVLRRSDGPKPTAADEVTVDYSGWLDNGQVFDSSYNSQQPVTFNLSQVVPGWNEGLQYVGEGGMIELVIPAELGYGSRSLPGIPPDSTLHFKVELHEVH